MTARGIDFHTLPAMLAALRLPSFGKRWQAFAEQADKEGWPAARFLAALAECEIAERETRRIQRHLNASRLPTGKTLATFDFNALLNIPRRRSRRSPPSTGSRPAPTSSSSATAAPARPIFSAASTTP